MRTKQALAWLLRCESPDPETAYKGRWASFLALCLAGVLVLSILISSFINPAALPMHVLRLVALSVLFLLNRRGRVTAAVAGATLIGGGTVLLGPFLIPQNLLITLVNPIYLTTAILGAGVFLGPRWVTGLVVVFSLGVVWYYYWADIPVLAAYRASNPTAINTIVAGLLILFFVIGIVAWVSSRIVLRAVANLHARNAELDQARAQLVLANNTLEQQVAARTQELTRTIAHLRQREADLVQARHAAEAASRAKSSLLTNMSHELRTPLNAILGFAGLLAEELDAPGHEQHLADLRKIQHAGQHLLTLVNNALDLASLDADRMSVTLATFDLAPLLDDLAETIRPRLDKNANRFVLRCPPDLGAIHADMAKLRQILLNLLNNAAKFTQQGLVTLEVLRIRQDGRDGLVWRVHDTGIGMTVEQQAHVFEPFYQADMSMSRLYDGSGLGLPLSWQLARLMGGDLTVVSEIGQGSTFSLFLPVEISNPAPPAAPTPSTYVAQAVAQEQPSGVCGAP